MRAGILLIDGHSQPKEKVLLSGGCKSENSVLEQV